MIKISNTNGGFDKTIAYLEKMQKLDESSILDKYGKMGVEALRDATPARSGKTASSWYYEVEKRGTSSTITWKNSNINKGVNIAIILQYGHGTRNGGFVQGVDYINPAILEVFNKILDELKKEVRGL